MLIVKQGPLSVVPQGRAGRDPCNQACGALHGRPAATGQVGEQIGQLVRGAIGAHQGSQTVSAMAGAEPAGDTDNGEGIVAERVWRLHLPPLPMACIFLPGRRSLHGGNAEGEFDPPLAEPHGLTLHHAERGGIAVLGAGAGDGVERLVQPMPFPRDLLLPAPAAPPSCPSPQAPPLSLLFCS